MVLRMRSRIGAPRETRIGRCTSIQEMQRIETQILLVNHGLQRGHFGSEESSQVAFFAAYGQADLAFAQSGMNLDTAKIWRAHVNVHLGFADSLYDSGDLHCTRIGVREYGRRGS